MYAYMMNHTDTSLVMYPPQQQQQQQHVQGNLARFREVWEGCVAAAASRPRFKVVAVSFPDLGDDTGLAIAAMGAVMAMDGGDRAGTIGGGGEGVVSEGPAEEKKKEKRERRQEEGGVNHTTPAAAAAAVREKRGAAAMPPAGGRALNVWQVKLPRTYVLCTRTVST